MKYRDSPRVASFTKSSAISSGLCGDLTCLVRLKPACKAAYSCREETVEPTRFSDTAPLPRVACVIFFSLECVHTRVLVCCVASVDAVHTGLVEEADKRCRMKNYRSLVHRRLRRDLVK